MPCQCLYHSASWLSQLWRQMGESVGIEDQGIIWQSVTDEGGSDRPATGQSRVSSDTDEYRHKKSAASRRTLIKNGFLYTAGLDDRVIEKAWILIEGKKIAAIGDMHSALPACDEEVDAAGKMILPGFVNPHWHESYVAPNMEKSDDSDVAPTPYARGGDIAALGSMFGFISGVGQKMTFEEGLAIARWSMWTQLRSGSTALGDLGSANRADSMGQAALDLGMRLRVSRWGSDIMLPANSKHFERVADTQIQADGWRELLEAWHDHPSGLVGGMPSVVGAFGSSNEQLQMLSDIVHQYQTPYAAHLAPLKNEREAVQRVFGRSPVERFDDYGLLTDRLVAVHTAYATETEYHRLLETGVNICHSPAHYGMLGEATNSETRQIARFLKDGVWVSSSTDGDIIFSGGMAEAMRGAHLGHNEANNCNTTCPPLLALKTGSLYGAKALGWLERIGSVEVGKEADIVLVDTRDYRYLMSQHPLRTFLITGNSKDVDTVFVQGVKLIEGGRSCTLDEQKLYQDYLLAAASVRQRLGAKP